MLKTIAIALLVLQHVAAQHDHGAILYKQGDAGSTTTLTAEQVAQLLAGDGMGLARPAEMNHYPGPRHVIELGKELKLAEGELRRVEAVRAAMLASARALGAQIVDAERSLDEAFRARQIAGPRLRELTATIARLQGELRSVHLGAHLETRGVLNDEQVAQYDVLRGYTR